MYFYMSPLEITLLLQLLETNEFSTPQEVSVSKL